MTGSCALPNENGVLDILSLMERLYAGTLSIFLEISKDSPLRILRVSKNVFLYIRIFDATQVITTSCSTGETFFTLICITYVLSELSL